MRNEDLKTAGQNRAISPIEEFFLIGEDLRYTLKQDMDYLRKLGRESGPLIMHNSNANHLLKQIAKLTRLIAGADKPDGSGVRCWTQGCFEQGIVEHHGHHYCNEHATGL
jgi:hypothetical protein